jgi:rhamnose transport system ATP-binding protein
LTDPVLSLSGVSKRFPGVLALDDVALELRPGEVTALVGENGAGKSTLVKILTGIYRPDEGVIVLAGEPVSFADPLSAWRAGITAIHQETVMFDELSVAENIFMGHQPRRGRLGLVDWRRMRDEAAKILRSLDAEIDPELPLKELSVAQKHLVGIAKALSTEARIVIMDEPTAALSQGEIADLFRIVRQLQAAGKAILFISHKFEEIFAIADRWAVFRDGRLVGAGLIGETDRDALVAMMVGRRLDQVFPKRQVPIGETVLEVDRLAYGREFADVSFSLRRGEILGFYGLVGAGRSEVMQVLFGINRPDSGSVRLAGQSLSIANPADAIRAGIAYVPEDRQLQGAILAMSIKDNVTLPTLERTNGGLLLREGRELAMTRRYGERLAVKAAAWDQHVETLSGGNQQKVVIARWLATEPKVMILDEPTKGIDVGSKAAVHDFMGELVEAGLAVILVSSELPEVMGMSDRILVMHRGHVVREFARAEATPEAIVTAATGGH